MSHLEEFMMYVRNWLEENAPKSIRWLARDPNMAYWGGKKSPLPFPEAKEWLEIMAAKGWTVPFLPKEYWGGGLTKEENKIFNE